MSYKRKTNEKLKRARKQTEQNLLEHYFSNLNLQIAPSKLHSIQYFYIAQQHCKVLRKRISGLIVKVIPKILCY